MRHRGGCGGQANGPEECPAGHRRPGTPALVPAGAAIITLVTFTVITLVAFTMMPVARTAGSLTARLSSAVKAMASAGPVQAEKATASAVPVQAESFGGTPAVGALFLAADGTGPGGHFCTASVVDSPHGDLVLTAAHCISGVDPGQMVFVPGYHDGAAPSGVWAVSRVIVDKNWMSGADPDDDVAFLVISPRGTDRVQDLTGGERFGVGQPPGQMVQVVGYPDGAAAPIRCENRVRGFSPTQLEFDCGGYADGTSGSPLLADVNPATGLGTVIGVIGGYEQGGYTSDVSYAARLSTNAAALYELAVSES